MGPCLAAGEFILSACLGRQSKGRGDGKQIGKLHIRKTSLGSANPVTLVSRGRLGHGGGL